MSTKKKLTDVIGNVYETTASPVNDLGPHSVGGKRFAAIHKADGTPIRGLSQPTDDDKLFNATNIAKTTKIKQGEAGVKFPLDPVAEGLADVYPGGMQQDPAVAQRNNLIQQHMAQSSQYGAQQSGHVGLSDQHDAIAGDMNVDPNLRNMHSNASDLHDQLAMLYANLAKYHDGKMSDAIQNNIQGH